MCIEKSIHHTLCNHDKVTFTLCDKATAKLVAKPGSKPKDYLCSPHEKRGSQSMSFCPKCISKDQETRTWLQSRLENVRDQRQDLSRRFTILEAMVGDMNLGEGETHEDEDGEKKDDGGEQVEKKDESDGAKKA